MQRTALACAGIGNTGCPYSVFLYHQDVLFGCALGQGGTGAWAVFAAVGWVKAEATVQKAVAESLPEVAVLVLSVGQGTRMPLARVELYAGHASRSGCT